MLINKNLISRNHTPLQRTKDQIQWIVVHYVGALGDAKANTDYYKSNDVGASADFFVGHNGDIWQANDYYSYYSWHCGGGESGTYFGKCTNANSVGIEMCVKKKSTATMNATDTDWYFTDETIASCVELTKHLMDELSIPADHVIRHFDVNGKWCPAPYCQNNTPHTWTEFKQRIGTPIKPETGLTQATQLNGLTEAEKVHRMAPLYQAEQKRSGMLASVGLAQFCLESGYGTTDLAQRANNLHGMKCSLSGNTWAGTSWDGVSKYTKQTAEQTAGGEVYYVTADFRKYQTLADSIADRSAYFIGAMNGDKKRYPDINKITDARKQIEAIKTGGYATDVKYVDKLWSLVERFNLTQYDSAPKQSGQKGDGTVKAIIAAAEQLDVSMRSDIKAGFPWTYTNKLSTKNTFDDACASGVRRTNCAKGVNWVLQAAGVFSEYPGRFYGKKGGTIAYQDKETKAAVEGKLNVIAVKSKTVNQCLKDGTIQPGDVVTYVDINHTNIYLGNNKWFDAGHAYCKTSGENAPFVKWVGQTMYGAYKVGSILRLKADVVPSKVYRVQVGAYDFKKNAAKRMTEVRDASGYGCFLEEIDGKYKVFCGSFEVKTNAEARVKELAAKKISAFIIEV